MMEINESCTYQILISFPSLFPSKGSNRLSCEYFMCFAVNFHGNFYQLPLPVA